MAPLGLLTVAAMLPPEWQLKLVDLNVEKLREDDLRWADYVLLGAMIVQKDSVHEIVEHGDGKCCIAMMRTPDHAFGNQLVPCWPQRSNLTTKFFRDVA